MPAGWKQENFSVLKVVCLLAFHPSSPTSLPTHHHPIVNRSRISPPSPPFHSSPPVSWTFVRIPHSLQHPPLSPATIISSCVLVRTPLCLLPPRKDSASPDRQLPPQRRPNLQEKLHATQAQNMYCFFPASPHVSRNLVHHPTQFRSAAPDERTAESMCRQVSSTAAFVRQPCRLGDGERNASERTRPHHPGRHRSCAAQPPGTAQKKKRNMANESRILGRPLYLPNAGAPRRV